MAMLLCAQQAGRGCHTRLISKVTSLMHSLSSSINPCDRVSCTISFASNGVIWNTNERKLEVYIQRRLNIIIHYSVLLSVHFHRCLNVLAA